MTTPVSKQEASHVAKGDISPPQSWGEPTLECTPIFSHEADQAFLLDNVLTEEECAWFIHETDRIGYDELNKTTKNYRVCTRAILKGEEVAEKIWSRIQPFIKPIEVTEEDSKRVGQGYRLTGTWKPVGLNVVWRFCHYTSGGVFAPHYDGEFVASNDLRSMKTFNLYLNGPLDGGTTNFIDDRQPLIKDSNGRYKAEDEYIQYRVKPVPGRALIFNHRYLHEGDYLKSGVKYLMRSDVMYAREEPLKLHEKERQAIELLKKASQLEDNHKEAEAVPFYMKAYKLWPALEETASGYRM